MQEIDSPAAMRAYVASARCQAKSIGFVATMGYLHRGHLALIEAAKQENTIVVLSIFVNPTQFGAGEDFDRYPRDSDRDRALARDSGVSVLFMPSTHGLYPNGSGGQRVWVDAGTLTHHLEGAWRPGHFLGVATVVTKLFNIVQPDRAYFGQKDAQQARVVTQLVRDLAFPIEVKIQPTARDDDGLALSSRNIYLTPEERKQASGLARALACARTLLSDGERDAQSIEQAMRCVLVEVAPLATIEYVGVADWESMHPVTGPIARDALIAVAARFRSTRLIDNEIVRFVDGAPQYGWQTPSTSELQGKGIRA
ncbi:MAG: pantoate--beta-alanine ligase [Chloroflexota bacterium]